MSEVSSRQHRLPAIAAGVISAVWIFAGTYKALDFSLFKQTVESHGVLNDLLMTLLPALPAIELLLGFSMIAVIGHGLRRVSLAIVTVSFLALSAMTIYTWLVPTAVLESVGCGCFGPGFNKIASGLGLGNRISALAVSAVLFILHVVAAQGCAHKPQPSQQ